MEFDIRAITKDELRDLIRSGDDTHDNQIRIRKSGIVFLSEDCVAAENIDGLAFRLGTFDAGNGYVGADAANDDVLIERLYKALKANWPNPRYTIIDDWNSDYAYNTSG